MSTSDCKSLCSTTLPNASHSDTPPSIQSPTPAASWLRPWFDQLSTASTCTVTPGLARYTGSTPFEPRHLSNGVNVIFSICVSIVNSFKSAALNTINALQLLATSTVELVLTTFLLLYLESFFLEEAFLHYHAQRCQRATSTLLQAIPKRPTHDTRPAPSTSAAKAAHTQYLAVTNKSTEQISQRLVTPCNAKSTYERTGASPLIQNQ